MSLSWCGVPVGCGGSLNEKTKKKKSIRGGAVNLLRKRDRERAGCCCTWEQIVDERKKK